MDDESPRPISEYIPTLPADTAVFRRLCRRCCRNADEEAKKGIPHPPIGSIPEVETFVSELSGLRIYLGTCVRCTDIEFTENWQRRYREAGATGNEHAKDKLERERQGWLRRGRKFYG